MKKTISITLSTDWWHILKKSALSPLKMTTTWWFLLYATTVSLTASLYSDGIHKHRYIAEVCSSEDAWSKIKQLIEPSNYLLLVSILMTIWATILAYRWFVLATEIRVPRVRRILTLIAITGIIALTVKLKVSC